MNWNFAKKTNRINTLRNSLKDKKRLLSKLRNIPEAVDECLKLQTEIKDLEDTIAELS